MARRAATNFPCRCGNEEIGIDISRHRSKSVDEFRSRPFDYVVTLCDNAKEACPVFRGAPKQIHWSLEDPAVQGGELERLAAFRRIRDQIEDRFRMFLKVGTISRGEPRDTPR